MTKLVDTVTNELNSFNFDYEAFCSAMEREHKTLQQSFTRLCVEWLRHCADMENFDARNAASVRIGKIVKEALKDESIPYI